MGGPVAVVAGAGAGAVLVAEVGVAHAELFQGLEY